MSHDITITREVDVAVEVEVYCICGGTLTASVKADAWGDITVTVGPCTACKGEDEPAEADDE